MKIEKDENGDEKLTIENEDDFQTFVEAYQRLQERAAKIATAKIKLEGSSSSIDYDEIFIEDGYLQYEYTTYCCGDREVEYGTIPAKHLFDDNWLEEAARRLEIKKQQEEEQRERKRIADEEAKRKREYDQYMKLKEQFDGGNK